MENVTETGKPFCGFDRQENWSFLLAEYTTRSLTFASDRIEALRGIANLYQNFPKDQYIAHTGWEIEGIEHQHYRKDGYIPEYGVWEDGLVFQLLWFSNGSCFNDGRLANMPSWTWATTESAKRWLSEGTAPEWDNTRRAEEMPERLVIASTGNLQICGHLSTIQSTRSYVRDELTARDLKLDRLQCLYDSWENFHILTQDIEGSYDKAVLVIAQFDDDRKTTYTHACFIAKQKDRSEVWGPQGKRCVKRECIVRNHYATIER
jgi:hypothetical protein